MVGDALGVKALVCFSGEMLVSRGDVMQNGVGHGRGQNLVIQCNR